MDQVTARKVSSPKVPTRVSSLPFESVPGQSRLFLDYLKDASAVRAYYPNAPKRWSGLIDFAPKSLENYTTDRTQLCDALAATNTRAQAGPRALENIDLLRDASCVAIVTGQQAGLFTGPLYTIYKALSAIKLAEQLKGQGMKAVPIFWAATEDHDLEEVSSTFFLNGENHLFSQQLGAEDAGLAVGQVEMSWDIHNTIKLLFRSLPQTDFSAAAKDLLSSAWAPGAKVGAAFLNSIASIFSGYGMIVLDPQDAELKRLSAPIYAGAIQHADEIVQAIVDRSAELIAKGYHAQVAIESDYFPLFWHDEGGRRLALRKIGDGLYRAKDIKTELTVNELTSLATETPDRLSPGVMLRPVVQDYLLPTLCYFGGAAEIAYFAQNAEVFRILDRPVTPILHRQSFTIVEKKQRKVLDHFGLGLEDLFAGTDVLTERLATEVVSPDSSKLFADAEVIFNAELDRLDEHISQIDPTVAANLATRRRKILYHLSALRRKTLLASIRRDTDTARQIAGLFAALLPNGGLQERSLNYFNFYNKFGPHLIDWLYQAVDLDDEGHRVIDL